MDGPPVVEEDFSSLSIEERIAHKNWKARASGYEELAKKFRILEEDSPEYTQYSYDIKKYVTDTNAPAQEKGLDATAAFLEFANVATSGKCVAEIMQGITAKCFNSRPKTKELGLQTCLLCVEVEQQEAVVDELIKGFSNKTPKIVIGCIAATTLIVSNFGPHVLPVKIILKGLGGPFAHNDKNIRNEARNLSIELCKWLKADVLRICLKDLKPVQLKELEEEWAKVVGENPKPTRYLRSKQQDQASAPDPSDDAAGGGDDGTPTPVDAAPAFDPLEMIEPVDLLSKLPENFYQNLTSAKWSERKDALVELIEEASKIPKLKSNDYGELLTAMNKIITKDNNINCVISAAKVVGLVAKGLKGQFEPQSKMFLTSVLEKMKEKKAAVVSVLSECADEIYKTTSLQNLHEEILEALENKNPNVKAETCLFTARSLCYCNPTTLTKPLQKALVPSLKKRLDDTTAQVRDAASTALGTCLKILGERPLAAFFEEIEKNKMAKIQEACEKAELKVPQGKKTKAKEETTKAKTAPTKTVKKAETKKAETKRADPPKQTGATKTTTKTAKATGTKTGAKKEGAKKDGAKKGEDYTPHFDPEPSPSSDDLDLQAKETIREDILTRLSDPKWKDRLDASNDLKEMIETLETENTQAQLYLHIIMIKPGLADGNLQVMNVKFSIICHLVKVAPDWGEKCTEIVLGALAEKLGEMKLKATATEALFLISERIQSLHFVANKVMSACCAHKSPKIQSECMNWMVVALETFGLQVKLPVYLNHIKNGLSSTNQTVKTSSIKLLGAFAVFFGSQKDAFKSMLGDINSNLESKIDKEIETSTANPPSVPTRSLKPGKTDGDLDEGGNDDANQFSVEDLIPRVDIGDRFKGELMVNLADKKEWKQRNEALQEIHSILKQNPKITLNLGDLIAGLKARLNDTNKNLVITTLNIISTLANCLGSLLSKIVRTLLPPILSVLSDAKPNVREAGITTLNNWCEQLKFSAFFEFEMMLAGIKAENPNQKAELMAWVSEKLKVVPPKQLPKQELLALVVPIGPFLEDRSGPVREKSKALLLTLVDCLGKDAVTKASSKASGQAIKNILGKLTPQVAVQIDKPTETNQVSEPQSGGKSNEKPNGASRKISSQTSAPPAPAPPPPEPEEIKTFRMGPTREHREFEEKKHGTLRSPRWEFDQPSTDHIRYLKTHFEKCMDPSLIDKLFDNDIQQQDKALKFIVSPSCLKGPFEKEIITCVDLFFKYIAMKLTEKNNVRVLKAALEFLKVLLEVLSDKNYVMIDFEANAIIPFLVQRMGNPNETLRKEVRFLIQNFCHIYSPIKMYTLISVGLISRNSKLKVDCIEVLGELIRDQGTGVCTPTPQRAIETIAKSISDSDHKTKNAALTCMGYVYRYVGDTLFKFVGNLPQKDKELLQEKIRKLPVPSSPPPPARPESQPSETQEIKQEAINTPSENLNEMVDSKLPNQEDPEVRASPVEDDFPSDNPPQLIQAPIETQTVPTLPTQRVPQRSIPKPSGGPFSVDVEAICKKHELKPTTPLSMLKRPTGYEGILNKPTNTTNYQTSALCARTQYAEDLPSIINNLASTDLSKVDENNRKLEQIIKLQPFKLVEYIDTLIKASLLQMAIFIPKLTARDTSEQLIRVLRGMLSCLISVVGIKILCQRIKRKNINDLFQNLAVFISNTGLNDFEEGVQIVRALNILTAKLLESVDQNELFSVLLELLLQSLSPNATPTVYTDIYMKCLWRLIRSLNDNINSIHINKLLFDVDQYFIAYAKLSKSPNDDKPFKTAKTIVYHVANILGQDIWNYTDMIWKREHSQVSVIIRKTLDKLNKSQDGNANYHNNDLSVSNAKVEMDTDGIDTEMTPASRLRAQLNQGTDGPITLAGNHEVNVRLAEIFTRIGSRDSSKQGLADLYDFMLAYPNTDLRLFLRNTSNIFQGFIERGLEEIGRERRSQSKPTSPSFKSHDIEIRNSYKILQDRARKEMDIELRSPPRKSPAQTSKFSSVSTPHSEANPNAKPLTPQGRMSPHMSPQPGPQKKTATKDLSSLKKRLEMASSTISAAAPSRTPASNPQSDKITELRDRLSRVQQNT